MTENTETPIRVLFVVGDLGVGGIQSGIMNFIRACPKTQVHFDILIHSSEIGFHEKRFSEYGTIYHVPIKTGKNKYTNIWYLLINNFLLKKRIIRVLAQHEPYQAIHCKSMYFCAATVEAGKKLGIPVRIAQCHVDKPERLSLFYRWYFHWCAKRIEKSATDKLAVSKGAVALMFCEYGGRIIKNPTISLERLDPQKYHPLPHEGIHLIQIGTYSARKNQLFSVKTLLSMLRFGVSAQLTFIGFPLDEPNYIMDVKKAVKENGLNQFVRFLAKDSDIPKELSESDYMLIPSLREGLPNVALEAQAMGVPCFLSDTITKATDCGLCTFLSLEKGPAAWADEIIRYRKEHGTEKKYVDMTSWDQKNVVKEYIQIWDNKKTLRTHGNRLRSVP